jgi:hypothetical protein
MAYYEVIVGNVGTIYSGYSKAEALHRYDTYVEISESCVGRAGGESIVLMVDGDISKEHEGRRSIE